MLIEEGKTNWLYILIIAFFVLAVIAMNIFFQSKLSKDLVVLEKVAIQMPTPAPVPKPVPMPTEINQGFLTQVNECFIPTAAVYGYALRVTSGFRSLSEQDAIYDSGRTEDGHIVSWAEAGKSMHNYGYAVDVVDRWRGYYANWKRLARIGEFCGLAQVDDPHFEYRGGLTTEQFNAGIRPVSLALPCGIMSERAKASQILTLSDLQNCGAPNFWN
jgi:hypothetical protein